MGTSSWVGAYNFPNIFSKQGHFQRITKQGVTNLFPLDKTKQSEESNIRNIKGHLQYLLCKSNESEFRRILSIVLVNFRRYVGEISYGISCRSMRYFEENAAE